MMKATNGGVLNIQENTNNRIKLKLKEANKPVNLKCECVDCGKMHHIDSEGVTVGIVMAKWIELISNLMNEKCYKCASPKTMKLHIYRVEGKSENSEEFFKWCSDNVIDRSTGNFLNHNFELNKVQTFKYRRRANKTTVHSCTHCGLKRFTVTDESGADSVTFINDNGDHVSENKQCKN